MKRVWLLCLTLSLCFLVASRSIVAQDAWRTIPMESLPDHHPLPFLKAIGIPAKATFRGKEYKAFVFISGHQKGPGVFGPGIDVYLEGLRNIVPEEELGLFDGPEMTDAEVAARTTTISIRRGKQTYQVSSMIDLHMGHYPASILQGEDNNVFGTSSPSRGPQLTAWKHLMNEMSSGFEEGHITFGGNTASSKIEICFSGNRIEPLLKALINFVGH
jgi:hypothetical protein